MVLKKKKKKKKGKKKAAAKAAASFPTAPVAEEAEEEQEEETPVVVAKQVKKPSAAYGHLGINKTISVVQENEDYSTSIKRVRYNLKPSERKQVYPELDAYVNSKKVLVRLQETVAGKLKWFAKDVPAKRNNLLSVGLEFCDAGGNTIQEPKLILVWDDGSKDKLRMPESLRSLS